MNINKIRDEVWSKMEPTVEEMVRNGKSKDEIERFLEQVLKGRIRNNKKPGGGLVGPNVWLKETLKNIPQ